MPREMLGRLFAAIGVDFDQWRALTVAALKLDYRSSSVGRMHTGPGSRFGPILFVLALDTIIGLSMALLVWVSRDLFLVGTTLMTAAMLLVGSVVLLDHNSALVSTTDYAVLGFRPIGSRTYLAVRLTNVVVYVGALTMLVAWIPVGTLAIRHGPGMGAAGLLAFCACSAATTLAILTGYAQVLRLAGPEVVRRALSYVQLAMSFLVFGGYVLVTQVVSTRMLASLTLPRSSWWLLAPPTWFGAYLELAAGRTGPVQIISALASGIVFVLLVSRLGGRLSLEYAERLGAMTTASAGATMSGIGVEAVRWTTTRHETLNQTLNLEQNPEPRTLTPRTHLSEARAVALLVRSQFRNDQRFRLGVLGILPLTALYVLMGIRDHSIGDPFARGGRFSLVVLAIMMFPSMLNQHLTGSEAFRASWVFFASPTDRMRLIRAAKNVLVACFLVPYLLLVTALYAYLVGNMLHVVVHFALIGLISHLVLQGVVLAEPQLPFSKPPGKGHGSAGLFGFVTLGSVLAALIQALSTLLYSSLIATVAAFALVLLASAGVDRLTRARVEQQAASLEFEG